MKWNKDRREEEKKGRKNMKVRIYQINPDRDRAGAIYMSYVYTLQRCGKVAPEIYDCIYEYVNPYIDNLEEVFSQFNRNPPADFKGRSLSVSDVIEVVSSWSIDPGFYFCDSIGFKRCCFDIGQRRARVVVVRPGEEPTIESIPVSEIEKEYLTVPAPNRSDILILFKDGKELPFNRTICGEEIKPLTYNDMANIFRKVEANGDPHVEGYIVFSQNSFDKEYSELSRTYIVSSDNKAYKPNMFGYSIFGTSMDNTDNSARLDALMKDEKGGPDGWKIERCYMKFDGKPIQKINGTFTVCKAYNGEIASLPDMDLKYYSKKFRLPKNPTAGKDKPAAKSVAVYKRPYKSCPVFGTEK